MQISYDEMQITYDNGTIHPILQPPDSPSETDKRQSDSESWWALDEKVGAGTWGRIALRPGFTIYISDFQVKESFSCSVKTCRPEFGFGFWMSGKTFGAGDYIPPKLFDYQGSAPLLFIPSSGHSGIVREQKNSHRRSIVLTVEPDLLHSLLRGTLDDLPKDARIFLDGATPGLFGINSSITTAMFQVMEALFCCPVQGAARRLFLESKTMKLLALRLDQALNLENAKRKPGGLRPDDLEKIHFAARKLCADLANPPSLFELSASVGISHVKLTNGFKQVFGVTPFGHLRQMRLNQAKILLETRQLNVTESAFAVGYNSLSSFARAFRHQYGYNPHESRPDKSSFQK